MIGVLVYDTTTYKVGCVLLQAAMGGSVEMANLFPSEYWEINPVPTLKRYPIEDEHFLVRLINLTIEHHGGALRAFVDDQPEGTPEGAK